MINRITLGGQTGADRAALDVAVKLGNRYNTFDIKDLKQAMKQLEDYRSEISNVGQTVDQIEKIKMA